MGQLQERRQYTNKRINKLQRSLNQAKKILGEKACVYATGSFGRLEAGEFSDLDLFIVGRTEDDTTSDMSIKKRKLSRLDEICVKAELIDATRRLNFPDFDGDGKYLAHYSVDELVKFLGTPEDDANNTLTGRLLLFLESQPLLGKEIYKSVIDDVIAAYWRDYEDHKTSFMPAFLTNDILRLWRTFCVNYEARTKRKPDENKIKGKIKNYKLKHSRMLTCYSALIYFLCVYKQNGTVSPEHAAAMTGLTPTERIEWLIGKNAFPAASEKAKLLLHQYEIFLENTRNGDEFLKSVFSDKNKSKVYMDGSHKFGDLMFETLSALGVDSKFFRLIVV